MHKSNHRIPEDLCKNTKCHVLVYQLNTASKSMQIKLLYKCIPFSHLLSEKTEYAKESGTENSAPDHEKNYLVYPGHTHKF